MRVGTSLQVLKYALRTEDHPHACGDKFPANEVIAPAGGSSPCVWGQEKIVILLSH